MRGPIGEEFVFQCEKRKSKIKTIDTKIEPESTRGIRKPAHVP